MRDIAAGGVRVGKEAWIRDRSMERPSLMPYDLVFFASFFSQVFFLGSVLRENTKISLEIKFRDNVDTMNYSVLIIVKCM